MKLSCPNSNAYAVGMNGYRDSYRNRNGALGVSRRIGTNISGRKVAHKGRCNHENRSYILQSQHG